MPDILWRFLEARLRPAVPYAHRASTVGDLAEDYERRRAATGRFRSALWLIGEAWSLRRAYRAETARSGGRAARLAVDLQYAWLRIARRPGVPLMAGLLLAVAIGLSTAMFGILDSLVFRPSPFPGGERLVRQGLHDVRPALIDAWRGTGLFEGVEAFAASSLDVELGDEHVRWASAWVTPSVFDLLSVAPLRGRTLAAGANSEAVVSERLWRTTFGADQGILQREIRANGITVRIVGVMPATFQFPNAAALVWMPMDFGSAGVFDAAAGLGIPTVIARLKRGVPFSAAEGRIKVLAREFSRLTLRPPGGEPPLQFVGDPHLPRYVTNALWLLLGAVGIVFVVMCATVGGLFVVDLASRQRELATSAALGAGGPRLIRQAAFQHAIIGLFGAAAGLAVAALFTSIVPAVFLGHSLNVIDLDLRALGVASGLGVAATLGVGLVPAWLGTRASAFDSLRGSMLGAGGGRPSRWLTRLALASEVALACSLLTGSVFLVRSFSNMANSDPGFAGDGVLRVSIRGLDDAFGWGRAMVEASDEIRERVQTLPDVAAVVSSREIPPGPTQARFIRPGFERVAPGAAQGIEASRYRVGTAFFDLYGLRILRGRAFDANDSDTHAIVGERLASALWGENDPIGQAFTAGQEVHRVVGVVREIRLPTLDATLDRPEYYTPLGLESRTLFLNMRCRSRCPSVAALEGTVRAVHPALSTALAPPADQAYDTALQVPRALAEVSGVFATVSMVTVAGGLFGVLSFAVRRRRSELGVRLALGASPRRIVSLVLCEGGLTVGVGLAAGVLGGWFVARALSSVRYGVTLADPLSWVAVVGTVLCASLAAMWRPAMEAVRVDPATLFRD